MEEVFLIEEFHICELTEMEPMTYYGIKGWVSTESEANKIVREGKTYTQQDCRMLEVPVPQFRYKRLKKCNTQSKF